MFDWFTNLFKPTVVTVPAQAEGHDIPLAPEPIPASGPATTPSANVVTLTKKQEGLVLTAYPDVDGVYVLGYGCKYFDGKPVVKGQTCDANSADRNCRAKLQECANAILSLTGPLTQGQLDALSDFVYNAGIGALQSSTILKSIKAKQPVTEDMFTRWNKIHKDGQVVELPALTLRRQAEYRLWQS